jgi:glycosyltransferase involved in cell wall biosynthesis
LDACNFTPKYFEPAVEAPTWDVLIVGRGVKFKRPALAIDSIRSLASLVPDVRVLMLYPMPNRTLLSWRSVQHDLPRRYERNFSVAERENITAIFPKENYPFPFNRRELSLFYRSSRVFVHFAEKETRCRVAAYAWATGMPVVGTAGIGDLLPSELLCEPAFYEVVSDDYVDPIRRALSGSASYDEAPYRKLLEETESSTVLVESLNRLPRSDGSMTLEQLLNQNLDIRLGWHHKPEIGANGPGASLIDFLHSLASVNRDTESALKSSDFPERLL